MFFYLLSKTTLIWAFFCYSKKKTMDQFPLDLDSSNVEHSEDNFLYLDCQKPQMTTSNLHTHYSTKQIKDIAQKVYQKHAVYAEVDRLRIENERLRSRLLDLKESSEKVQHIVHSEKHKAEYLKSQNLMLQQELKEYEQKDQMKISSRELLVAENMKLWGQIQSIENISIKYIQLVYSIFHKNLKSVRAHIMIKNIREAQEYIRALSSEKRHSINHILSWNPSDDVQTFLQQYKFIQRTNNQEIEYAINLEKQNEQNIESYNMKSIPENESITQLPINKVDVGTMFPEVIVYEKSFITKILKEMSKTIDHITPIAELEPELVKRNRSTNTDNVWNLANLNQNHSLPPSRINTIKTEKTIDNRSGLLKLWEILGQTIVELIQQGKKEFEENEMGFFNDKMKVMAEFLQQEKDKQYGKFIFRSTGFYRFLQNPSLLRVTVERLNVYITRNVLSVYFFR